jgi:hypothetical protein
VNSSLKRNMARSSAHDTGGRSSVNSLSAVSLTTSTSRSEQRIPMNRPASGSNPSDSRQKSRDRLRGHTSLCEAV